MRKDESMSVEAWPIDRVIPFEGNPRTITEAAVIKVAALIEAFGWRQPIVVDDAGVIVVGHTRRLAAIRLGLETVPVHVAVGLTARETAAYRLADNRSNEEASWDMGKLAISLGDLAAAGFDMKLTAFDPPELPGVVPVFGETPDADVKRLDRKAEVSCPACGEKFAP
jgi:ParB-like chromosome segregation protein Spo0J